MDPCRGPGGGHAAPDRPCSRVLLDSADGTVLATAEGTYVAAPEDRKQALKERYGFRLEPDVTDTPATVDRSTRNTATPAAATGRSTTTVSASTSPATTRAKAFVAAHKAAAVALGRAAGEHVHDPDTLVTTLNAGLPALADPEYHDGMQLVAPGIGPVLGIRQPLLRAIGSGLRVATRGVRASSLLDIAARLVREPLIELHWLAYMILERTVRDEPERTWQLVRAEGRTAHEWATVDALARVAALGIAAEPYRWAELEQLVYSPSAWSAAWPGRRSRPCRSPTAASAVGPRSPRAACGSSATSWVTRRPMSSGRSRGPSAR